MEHEICVDVRKSPPSLKRRRRYEISIGGYPYFSPQHEEEVVPYVEWAINWEIPRLLSEYVQLHSAAMEYKGRGVIFPGSSGSGKSTLTAGLLAGGWRYLCDEFALIHELTLHVHPFPRAICIKRPSFPVVNALGIKPSRDRPYTKGAKGKVRLLSPADVRPDAVGQACPVRYIIFPKYESGARPELVPMSRAQAAFALHRVCINLLRRPGSGLVSLTSLVRGARCFRLVAGDISSTCSMLTQLVEERDVAPESVTQSCGQPDHPREQVDDD